ncbi:NADP oxidoreductase [bacterium]|nr:NADP oxidoreductase [bacterium]
MAPLGSEQRPLRVAIVGSGPSGFYAADALFKSAIHVSIDSFDRLPTPFGLLRGGVAPDHQKMKSVGAYYERVADANATRFRWFGNVEVGRDITIDELKQYYDAVILAVGAQTDRTLGIPGETKAGVYGATEFVGWYNGHPDYQNLEFDLNHESVVVIGQGNVAIDVTRILVKPIDELRKTDIPDPILNKLATSKVKTVHLVGRRGPVQSAFTELEIKEFGEIHGVDVVIDPSDMAINPASQSELDDDTNNKAKKNMAVLRDYVANPRRGGSKQVVVRFLEGPVEIGGDDRVSEIILEKNNLIGDPGHQQAVGTGEKIRLNTGLIFKSIGYKGTAIPGVPFDQKSGTIPHQAGAIVGLPGCYVAGWIKRGPRGVLGTNKPCSTETIATLLADLERLRPCSQPELSAVEAILSQRGVRWITYSEWKKIDKIEKERGTELGKPREKFTRLDQILEVLG